MRGIPRAAAQRPLPSMMIAMCLGSAPDIVFIPPPPQEGEVAGPRRRRVCAFRGGPLCSPPPRPPPPPPGGGGGKGQQPLRRAGPPLPRCSFLLPPLISLRVLGRPAPSSS